MIFQWRKTSLLFFACVLCFCLAPLTRAQVDRGAIVGTVTDASGLRVAEAQVAVTNLETNQSNQFPTDAEGNYSAPLLKIGRYSVRVEKSGFQSTVETNIEVSVNQIARVDISIKVGATTETVEVTSAPALLQTETSSLGTIETTQRISQLPLNGRNFIQLAYLGPGANGGQTGSNVSGGVFENERANEAISVNGLRVSNNNFLLNGVDNNEFGLGGTIVLPPPDAIEEFKTEENSMAAEFGRGGAAVNVVTKSGSNHIHGGVYEFIRNDKLDAVNYFNQGQQPFKRNQFGAFAGGPLKKNKAFLFGDYQGSRLRESTPAISTVPTMKERSGDFTELLTGNTFSPCDQPGAPAPLSDPHFDTGTIFDPYSTTTYNCSNGQAVALRTPISNNGQVNVMPTGMINAVGRNILNVYPQPTTGDLAQNYVTGQPHSNDQDSFDVRFDYRFRDEDQIFAAYSFGDVRSSRPGPLGMLGGSDCCPSQSKSRAQHVGLGYTHTFSSTLLNDLHGGWFRYAVNALPFNYGNTAGNDLQIPNANRGDINSSGLTNIDISGITPIGDSLYLPEHVYENIYQVADTLTWLHGRHSFKFGFDFRRQQRNFYQVTAPRGYFNFGGIYTNDLTTSNGGGGAADVLLGLAQQTEQDYLLGLYPTRYWDQAEFVQDNWKIRPYLTLNLGLRYDLTSPANGRVSNFDLTRAVMVSSYGSNAISHAGVGFDKSNIQPRIGLAWSLPHNTVVRSAFGIFYSSEANIFDDLGLNPPQLTFFSQVFNPGVVPLPPSQNTSSQLVSNGFPDTLPVGDPSNISGPVKTTGSVRKIPKILEWNLTVQHQFAQTWTFQIGYVGTHAYRLWNHEASDLNQPTQILDTNFVGPDPNNPIPNYGRRYYVAQPNLTAVLPLDFAQLQMSYNALQMSLNKNFSNGFNILAAYTFAKNLGNADGNVGGYIQNSYYPNLEHGPVTPDLRHRASISYIYELPFGKGRHFAQDMNRIAEAALGGWQISGITTIQSGEALTATISGDITNTGSFSPRYDQIHNPNDFSFNTSSQANDFGCSNPGHQTLDCWYNQAAFVPPALAPGQLSAHLYGRSPIGNLRGPDLVDFDFVLQKNFRIRESQQLEFRAEFFNIFNHPNFGLPGNVVDVQGGAAITNTSTDNRQIEFALKYTF